jgi:hypothetical protein
VRRRQNDAVHHDPALSVGFMYFTANLQSLPIGTRTIDQVEILHKYLATLARANESESS